MCILLSIVWLWHQVEQVLLYWHTELNMLTPFLNLVMQVFMLELGHLHSQVILCSPIATLTAAYLCNLYCRATAV